MISVHNRNSIGKGLEVAGRHRVLRVSRQREDTGEAEGENELGGNNDSDAHQSIVMHLAEHIKRCYSAASDRAEPGEAAQGR